MWTGIPPSLHFLGPAGGPNGAFKGSHTVVHQAIILAQAELKLFLLLDSVKEHSSVGWSVRCIVFWKQDGYLYLSPSLFNNSLIQ